MILTTTPQGRLLQKISNRNLFFQVIRNLELVQPYESWYLCDHLGLSIMVTR